MKNLVVYSSVTGNTKKIAEAISKALPECTIAAAEDKPNANEFDNVFVGFWCDKGFMDEKAKQYLQEMKPREVAIFGTLGGNPKTERAVKFAEKVKNAVPDHIQVIDLHMWQGKVDPKVIEMMMKMPGMPPMTPEHQARLDEAAKHPDNKDCEEAALWATDIVNSRQKR